MDLSIIIPTLNEEQYILSTLARIENRKSDHLTIEVIVVDAGSTDDTVQLTEPRVDLVIQDEKLKGLKYKSLNRGAQHAKGEILLFLDADSLVPDHFDLLIKETLNHSGVVGGAFEFQMDEKGWIFRMIEWINRLRYRIDRRYFGDQGIFCTHEAFRRSCGYPQKSIMEAAYFCKVLRKAGKLALVSACLTTSARRFREGNPIRVFAKDAWIWIQFSLGLNVERYALNYWKENEHRN